MTKEYLCNQGIVDLTWASKPEDLAGIAGFRQVGMVMAYEDLVATLYTIPMENVGLVVAIPREEHMILKVGQFVTTGESLATISADDLLFIAGQMIITTPVEKINARELQVHGQVFAPVGSESAIDSKLKKITGQILYYPAGTVRVIIGIDTFDRAFLEALPEPLVLVVVGNLTFAKDVPADLLKQTIRHIALMGNINAPKAIVPIVHVLTPQCFGTINGIE